MGYIELMPDCFTCLVRAKLYYVTKYLPSLVLLECQSVGFSFSTWFIEISSCKQSKSRPFTMSSFTSDRKPLLIMSWVNLLLHSITVKIAKTIFSMTTISKPSFSILFNLEKVTCSGLKWDIYLVPPSCSWHSLQIEFKIRYI